MSYKPLGKSILLLSLGRFYFRRFHINEVLMNNAKRLRLYKEIGYASRIKKKLLLFILKLQKWHRAHKRTRLDN